MNDNHMLALIAATLVGKQFNETVDGFLMVRGIHTLEDAMKYAKQLRTLAAGPSLLND